MLVDKPAAAEAPLQASYRAEIETSDGKRFWLCAKRPSHSSTEWLVIWRDAPTRVYRTRALSPTRDEIPRGR
jgi:hypothetical protein